MAPMINAKSRYLQRASLCYEIAETLKGERIIAMVHLGDLYSNLAAALRSVTDKADSPECARCRRLMEPTNLLPKTDAFPARLIFHCQCGEALTCRAG
jgi:hypothetical protein